MNKFAYILFLIFIAVSCKNSISEADKKRAIELNNKAVQFRMNGDLENAKEYYTQAIKTDQSNSSIRYALIGVYVQQDSLDKAFKILEETPAKQKETGFYYQVKGGLYEFSGPKEKAIENYKKALELSDKPKVKDELDLGPLVNYAMLETLAGYKEKAVNRLNKTLNLDWLTESNKRYLETFRNEFEYYQGNGNLEFDPKNDITIRTTNPDSIESILKENHINISGSSSGIGNDITEIYVSEKYRSGLEKLNIKNAP